MQFNFNEQISKAEEEYEVGRNNNFFSFEEGKNTIRILTPAQPLGQHFLGKGQKSPTCYGKDKGCRYHGEDAPKTTVRWICYILDENNEIKLAFLPHLVIKAIGQLQNDEDYSFDELPMPYDLKINYDPKNSNPQDKYKIIPSPQRNKLSDKIIEELEVKLVDFPVENFILKMKNNQMKKDGITSLKEEIQNDEVNPEDISF